MDWKGMFISRAPILQNGETVRSVTIPGTGGIEEGRSIRTATNIVFLLPGLDELDCTFIRS